MAPVAGNDTGAPTHQQNKPTMCVSPPYIYRVLINGNPANRMGPGPRAEQSISGLHPMWTHAKSANEVRAKLRWEQSHSATARPHAPWTGTRPNQRRCVEWPPESGGCPSQRRSQTPQQTGPPIPQSLDVVYKWLTEHRLPPPHAPATAVP